MAKTKPAAKGASPAMKIPKGGAAVRMYCTGLGDCFLIAFHGQDSKPVHVLIDFGVYKTTKGAAEWMTKIMAHILETVPEKTVDVLVVTHRHYDHISGFKQAASDFAKLNARSVWMPWIAEPGNPAGLELAALETVFVRAGVAAVQKLCEDSQVAAAAGDGAAGSRLRDAAAGVLRLLAFAGCGPDGDQPAAAADASAADLAAAAPGESGSMESLMDLARNKAEKPRYLTPSLTPVKAPSFGNVRVYALGPPTSEARLKKQNPSGGAGKEVYIGDLPFGPEAALLAAASDGAADARDEDRANASFPFDRSLRTPFGKGKPPDGPASDPEFFRRLIGTPGTAWRRIDTDWLGAAESLALKYDSILNNTSLVLAFELGEGGPVLLFPGDAQVGNWLSWHDLQPPADHGVTAADLLARTVLYKVGHHASHNATLKDKGLELMAQQTRLVAMIPVDEAVAHEPKGGNPEGWDMPYSDLLRRLMQQTEDRVLRADRGLQTAGPATRPAGWTEARWKRWQRFLKGVRIEMADQTIDGKKRTRPLYVEYAVEPEA